MRISWKVQAKDLRAIEELESRMAKNPFVRRRVARNVTRRTRRKLTRHNIWEAMLSCLLTTQQPSGPGSGVNRLVTTKPFPLSLTKCHRSRSVSRFIAAEIRRAGGIRRGPTIGKQAAQNLRFLEAEHGWEELLPHLRSLDRRGGASKERAVARYVASHLVGFGPKQSRNLLQMLGLSRYEIPLDSRIARWLNANYFPVRLSAANLADPDYYEFAMNGVQALCEKAGILPCVLDAMVFASYDREVWTKKNLAW